MKSGNSTPNAEAKIFRALVVVVAAFLIAALWFMASAVDDISAADCGFDGAFFLEGSE